MTEIMFSIITPTFNSESTIESTILSVLNQDEELYEYIIIDGNSYDNTLSIVRKYEHKIRWISEKDHGVYDALNKGITYARGKYLYFLGSGDLLCEGVLSKISKELQPEYHLLYGYVFNKATKKYYGGKFNKYTLAIKNICHQAIFYKRDIFELIGLYDLKYSVLSDYALNLKCFGHKTLKIKYVPVCIALYEGSGLSTTTYDYRFDKDKRKLILESLGFKAMVYAEVYESLKKNYLRLLKLRR